MALADSTKVDFLWKKLGFGVTKTDTPANKEAFNESIPSPLLLRGDKVWQQSADIPAVIPSANTAVVAVYKDGSGSFASTVECTEDITASDNRTWKTNITDWIPTEFGSTYLVKVYVANVGVSDPQSVGTQLFQAGSGNDDEWFFDYSSGVLNFNGANIPSQITTGITGKSVYISGARYIGEFGVGGNTVGNLTVTDTTVSTVNSGDDIIFAPDSGGIVSIDTTTSLLLPVGNTAQRPGSPTEGYLRFNSGTNSVEVYDGTAWDSLGGAAANITSQTISGDDSTTVFTLNQDATAAGIIVSTNGVVQQPAVAYTVTGNQITFAEAPISSDTIDVRFVSSVSTINEITNSSGNSSISVDDSGVANIATVQSLQLPSYTTAQAANLANIANGQIIYVTNGDSGSPCLAVYSVDNWKRVALGANIAGS